MKEAVIVKVGRHLATDNRPQAGWGQLFSLISRDYRTAYTDYGFLIEPVFATDMSWDYMKVRLEP